MPAPSAGPPARAGSAAARPAAPGTAWSRRCWSGRPGQGVRPGDGPGPDHRGRRPDRRPPPHRGRGARPGPGRRPGPRVGRAAGRRARHRQVDPAARACWPAWPQRRAGAVRLRRGVARAGPPAGRAPRGPPPRAAAGRRDRPRGRPHPGRAGQADRVVVDSVQTVADPELAGAPGGVGQVREVAAQLVRLAKERSIATFLVGQVTKDGAVAGPKTLEHLVDVVLNFEGDQHHALRLVRCTKNRFGPAYEVGCFEMTEAGLEPLADPSRLFLSARSAGVPGVACTVSLEGRRPLVTEVQALVVPTGVAVPRRTAQGLDAGRLAILVAVLDRRARIGLAGNDVFAATAGGVRITEPAADLAVCLALASAARDRQVPSDLITIGEVGLGGEVRPVPQLPRRLAEAARLGFRRALVPATGLPKGTRAAADIELDPVGSVAESLSVLATPPPSWGWCPMSLDDRLLEVLRQVAPGTALRPGLERILTSQHRGPGRARLPAPGGGAVHRRVPDRRAVHRPAPLRAGQDGRRPGPGRDRHPHPLGQRPPDARPGHPHGRDRHPPPHRRAGGQAGRGPGDLGLPLHAHHHPVRRGLAPRARGRRRGAVAGQPGGGRPGPLPGPLRRGQRRPRRPRAARPGHPAGRPDPARAGRDGAPGGPRAGAVRGRAGQRRPPAPAPAGGAERRRGRPRSA